MPVSPKVRDRISQFQSACRELGFNENNTGRCLVYSTTKSGRNVSLSCGVRGRTQYLTPDVSVRMYDNIVISIQVETPIMTRMLFLNSGSGQSWLVRFIQRRYGNKPLGGSSLLFGIYQVWVSEPTWAEAYLSDPQVIELLRPLLIDADGNPTGNVVHFGPRACGFVPCGFPEEMTADVIDSWLQSLCPLVELAEKNPPTQQVKLSWIERQANEGRLTLVIVVFLVGIPLLMMFVCGGFVVLLALIFR